MENIDADHILPRLCGATFGPGVGGLVTFHNGAVGKCGNGTSALIRIDFPPSRLDWGAVRPCCRYFRESKSRWCSQEAPDQMAISRQCPRSLQDGSI
jgi:hypothetical protein